jgi:uncharacterized protein (TIGR03437 family)
MAYDSKHGQVLLFGGFDGLSSLSDTWQWDGTNWNLVTPQNSPSARCFHEMTYDSAHDQVILFGGGTTNNLTINSGLSNDTWLWDGSSWTQATPTNSPPARNRFGMAFDAGHALAVLFGGRISDNGFLGDTWTWSGGPVTTPPTVTSVLDQAAGTANLTPGMPIQVTGTGFGNSSSDIATVTIGNEVAPVLTFNSSTSVIAQAPVDAPLGPNTLTVSYQGQPSVAFHINLVALAPEIEPAASANGSSFYDSSGNPITSAHPALAGSEVYLLAIGLGTTNPPQVTNTVATAQASTTRQVQVMVGSKMVQPDYAGLFVGGTPGYYQVSFKVPPDATVGNQPVTLLEGGLTSTVAMLTVAPPAAVVVSAANSTAAAIAPGSLATAYGSDLAQGIPGATSLPLPTSFGGTSVTIVDSQGATSAAPLLYVNPTQVNFEVPQGVATGDATVTVTSGDGTQSIARVQIAQVAPGLFELNSDGLAAAYVILYHSDQTQTVEKVYTLSGGDVVATPVSLGSSTDQAYLFLFGTGLEAAGAGGVTVSVGGTNVDVKYAGTQGSFAGLDQVNVVLPHSLAGSGNVTVQLTASGVSANPVQLAIQ